MSTDPYAAPKSRVADTRSGSESFVPEGRSMAAGNGWAWVTDAWGLVKQNLGAWIVLFIIFVVIVIVLSFIPLLGALALYVVTPILMGGLMLGCEAVRKGEPMTVAHLLAGFGSNAGKLAGVGLFTLVAYIGIFVVVMAIFGFSIAKMFMGGMNDPAAVAEMGMTILLAVLIVLALSIPIYMAMWFSYPLIVLNDYSVGQALKASFSACLKNVVPFLVYGIVMFVLAIVASIPLLLGWLLLGPVLLASLYTSYRDIFYTA